MKIEASLPACSICGAVVATDLAELHEAWHVSVAAATTDRALVTG